GKVKAMRGFKQDESPSPHPPSFPRRRESSNTDRQREASGFPPARTAVRNNFIDIFMRIERAGYGPCVRFAFVAFDTQRHRCPDGGTAWRVPGTGSPTGFVSNHASACTAPPADN